MNEPRASSPVRSARGISDEGWTYRAFGLTWSTEFAWPGVLEAEPGLGTDVLVELVDETDIDSRWSGAADGSEWYLRIDDKPMRVTLGAARDFRLVHGDNVFHVTSDGDTVSCATANPADPWWLRSVLDTVLWSTALLRGNEALHASAVLGPHGLVAFLGRSGGGKTTMALEFLRRGYSLFCDDVLAFQRGHSDLNAFPSPPFINVPSSRASDPSLPITPIATLGDETWSVTTRHCLGEAPPVQLVFLDRQRGSEVALEPVRSSVAELRRFCLAHGLLPERERARFELCSDLAACVQVSRLRADLVTEPGTLADLVESVLEPAAEAS